MNTKPITLDSTPEEPVTQGQKVYLIVALDQQWKMPVDDVVPHSIWLTIKDAEKELKRLIDKYKNDCDTGFTVLEIEIGARPIESNITYSHVSDYFHRWPQDKEILTDEHLAFLNEEFEEYLENKRIEAQRREIDSYHRDYNPPNLPDFPRSPPDFPRSPPYFTNNPDNSHPFSYN